METTVLTIQSGNDSFYFDQNTEVNNNTYCNGNSGLIHKKEVFDMVIIW